MSLIEIIYAVLITLGCILHHSAQFLITCCIKGIRLTAADLDYQFPHVLLQYCQFYRKLYGLHKFEINFHCLEVQFFLS